MRWACQRPAAKKAAHGLPSWCFSCFVDADAEAAAACRNALRSAQIKMFVLDEADEMLSRGFKDQIYDIFQLLPPKLQVRCMLLRVLCSRPSSLPFLSSNNCTAGSMALLRKSPGLRPDVSTVGLNVLRLLQVGVFSATLPPDALDITRKFMNKPVRLCFVSLLLEPDLRHSVLCLSCTEEPCLTSQLSLFA